MTHTTLEYLAGSDCDTIATALRHHAGTWLADHLDGISSHARIDEAAAILASGGDDPQVAAIDAADVLYTPAPDPQLTTDEQHQALVAHVTGFGWEPPT